MSAKRKMFLFTSAATSIALVLTNNVRKPDNPELPLGFDLDNLGTRVRADSQYGTQNLTLWKSIKISQEIFEYTKSIERKSLTPILWVRV